MSTAFPIYGKGESGLTKREYFAAHAPAMPDWYREKSDFLDPETRKISGKEKMFFSWRWYYADMMIEQGSK